MVLDKSNRETRGNDVYGENCWMVRKKEMEQIFVRCFSHSISSLFIAMRLDRSILFLFPPDICYLNELSSRDISRRELLEVLFRKHRTKRGNNYENGIIELSNPS